MYGKATLSGGALGLTTLPHTGYAALGTFVAATTLVFAGVALRKLFPAAVRADRG